MIEMITGTLATPDQMARAILQAQQESPPHPDCVVSGPGRNGVTQVIWFCETCDIGWSDCAHPDLEEFEEHLLPRWFDR